MMAKGTSMATLPGGTRRQFMQNVGMLGAAAALGADAPGASERARPGYAVRRTVLKPNADTVLEVGRILAGDMGGTKTSSHC
jgi:hypothetical protein